MIAPFYLFIIVSCYVLLLFGLAYYAEGREREGRSIVNNPYIYALSLAVYCTSWTFYGSVGRAATSGISFLAVYVGPTVMVALWPLFLRKIVRVAKTNRITTISDFIASRYGKSLLLSVLVTVVAVVGLIPYIGLQLKAITSTFVIISGKTSWTAAAGFVIAFLLGIFTIIFGARRLDTSERHGGIVFAIAFESIVKLAAFLLIGIFVAFTLFDGFGDIVGRIRSAGYSQLFLLGPGSDTSYPEWFAILFLGMMAIVFLPRQFHMAVVENNDEEHIKKVVWLFPLYLLLITLFVLPVAIGGLLLEGTAKNADYFVLNLPLHHGGKWLAVVAFLGGFSAATGMVIVESLALSTMVMNSVIMPLLIKFHHVPKFAGIALNIKRLVILGITLLGYLFTVTIGPFENLVDIGLKSFEAVTLFAPAFILGLYWKRGNRTGAVAGLSAGFLIWFYTVIIPVMMKAGLIDKTGAIGMMTATELFNPNSLFGVSGLGKWEHTLFWSLLCNVVFYIGVSAFTRQSKTEEVQSLAFVESFEAAKGISRGSYTVKDIEDILSEYLERAEAKKAVEGFLIRKEKKAEELSADDLSELRDEAEKTLSGAVGPSMASIIFENRFVLTENERRDISESIRRSTESLRLTHKELAEANRELQYRASMEQYIATISTDFINLSPEEIDNGIRSSLEAAGKFTGCDGGFVVLFSGDGPSPGVIYRWSSEYLEQEMPLFRDFSPPSFPWWMEKLRRFENIAVPRVSELPSRAEAERAFLKSQGVLSLVAVPLVSRGALIGFLGFCSITREKMWIEADFSLAEMLGIIFVNALERKKAEEALRESEGKYRTLVNNVNIGVYRNTGGPQGRFIQANPAIAKMFGYDSVEEFMGVSVAGLYRNPDERKRFVEEIMRDGFVKDKELALKKKDGTPIWCSVTAAVQYDENGNVTFMNGVIEDVTERKQAEQELRKAHDELETKVQERTAELSVANEQLRQRHLESSILYKVSSVIAGEIHMERLLAEVLDTISRLELFTVDKGGIFVVEGDRMRMIANVGHSDAFLQLHKDMKVGDCLCGLVAKTGELMISMNSAHDERHTIVIPDAAPHGHLIVPLKTKDRVEGVLDLYVPADAAIDEAKVRLMQSIGNQLGIAIENARLYEETKALSLRDSLTGLWNHEEILRILARELDRAEREGTSVGVVMADLDHFKKINDAYGHLAGDAVLRAAAERMLSLIRPYDAVGRYGGEEFLVVLPGCAGKCAVGIAERVRRSIGGERINTPEGPVPVTISLGVAESLMDTRRDANFLVQAADAALYRAKEKGRNRVETATDDEKGA